MFEFLKDYKEFFADASKEDLTKAWQEEQERQEREQERQEREQERQLNEREQERQYELEKLRLQRGDDAKGLPLAPCPSAPLIL
jgi:CO dehydrogenase/acetyl-CoA synthase beta subunit